MAEELFSVIETKSGGSGDNSEERSTIAISCYVQPGAGRASVVGRRQDALHVRVAPPPADGRANEAVESLIADLLDVPRSTVSIIAGQRSRQKRVRVEDVELERVRSVLLEATIKPSPRSGGSEGRIHPRH